MCGCGNSTSAPSCHCPNCAHRGRPQREMFYVHKNAFEGGQQQANQAVAGECVHVPAHNGGNNITCSLRNERLCRVVACPQTRAGCVRIVAWAGGRCTSVPGESNECSARSVDGVKRGHLGGAQPPLFTCQVSADVPWTITTRPVPVPIASVETDLELYVRAVRPRANVGSHGAAPTTATLEAQSSCWLLRRSVRCCATMPSLRSTCGT